MKHSLFIKLMRRMQNNNAKKCLKRLATDYNCKKVYDLNYMNDGDENHLCDLYYTEENSRCNTPVILEIHGGGFMTGTKQLNEGHGLYYASRGYKVVNVNYTLQPEVTLIEEIQELFQALHWIEKKRSEISFRSGSFIYFR